MSQYMIIINQLQGVELVLNALRSTSCIASHDLADGIVQNLYYKDDAGKMYRVDPVQEEPEPEVEKKAPVNHPFQVIEGGKE